MAVLGEETQITCRFTTKLPKEYRVPPSTVVRAMGAGHCLFSNSSQASYRKY